MSPAKTMKRRRMINILIKLKKQMETHSYAVYDKCYETKRNDLKKQFFFHDIHDLFVIISLNLINLDFFFIC